MGNDRAGTASAYYKGLSLGLQVIGPDGQDTADKSGVVRAEGRFWKCEDRLCAL